MDKKNTKQTPLAEIVKQIRKFEKRTVGDVVAIGGLLEDAKEQLPHGQFETWIATHFAWSKRTAVRYRDAHAFASNLPRGTFEKLNISVGGLYALAALADPEIAATDSALCEYAMSHILTVGAHGARITRQSIHDALEIAEERRQEKLAEAAAKAAAADAATGATKSEEPPEPDDDDTPEPPPPPPAPRPPPPPVPDWKVKADRLADQLRALMVYRPDDAAWQLAIETAGFEAVRQLNETLRININKKYSGSSRDAKVKAAADRAAAQSQSTTK